MTPRCLVDHAEWLKSEFTLDTDASYHLLKVLRMRAGMRIVVFDGCGGEAAAEIIGTDDKRAVVRVLNRSLQDRPAVALILIQALPKAQKMDLIVQKATELGVASIVPVMTERGVVQLDEDRAAARRERWQKIAAGAAEQCGAGWLPHVEPVTDLKSALAGSATFDLLLVGSLEATAEPLKAVVARAKAAKPRRVALLIGPEGDFAPAEIAAARTAGAVPVSFGPRTLRAETAAIFCLSVLAYELL